MKKTIVLVVILVSLVGVCSVSFSDDIFDNLTNSDVSLLNKIVSRIEYLQEVLATNNFSDTVENLGNLEAHKKVSEKSQEEIDSLKLEIRGILGRDVSFEYLKKQLGSYNSGRLILIFITICFFVLVILVFGVILFLEKKRI